MKAIALYILFVFSLISCNSIHSDSFRLEGFVENAEDGEDLTLFYISQKNGKLQEFTDTTTIVDGKFLFEGNLHELTAAELCFSGSAIVFSVRMYLEPTSMKLRVDKNKPYAYELLGTKVEKENRELRKVVEADEKASHECLEKINEIHEQIMVHNDNMSIRDSLYYIRAPYMTENRAIRHNIYRKYLDFSVKHNNYQIIPDLLYLVAKADNSIPIDTIKHIYNLLPEQSKNSLIGKFAYKQINYREVEENIDCSVGSPAPDFTRKDFMGKTVRLSDFKNKQFVLLDFWANWCGPCLAEIPTIKGLHEKYHEKGLAIISISLDTEMDKWHDMINKHHLDAWSQVLSIEEENSNTLFNTDDLVFMFLKESTTIPHYVLIDKQGIVLAHWKGLGDEQLKIIDDLCQ